MEAEHVATTTTKRNMRKGKTKIKIYQQPVIVGVLEPGNLQEKLLVRRQEGEPQQRRCPDPGELEEHQPC